MDQQISGPGELQRRCISVIIEQLTRVGRTNSISDLEIPPSIVQQIEGIYQWELDVSVILELNGYFIACVPNTSPFFGHFRWTNENSVLKIDRRATASAQLDNFDPSNASTELIKFAFVLAAMYCLEDHIRQLLRYRRSTYFIRSLTDMNPTVVYWSRAMAIAPNQNSGSNDLLEIRPQQVGSSEFWLAVIRSFWPVANQQLNGVNFQRWTNRLLRYAMEYRYKSVIDYVWAHYTTDEMRKSLISATMHTNGSFLNWTIRADEKEILFEFLSQFDDYDARRAAISCRVDQICTYFEIGNNSEMYEHLLDCMIIDCASIPSDNIARALCKLLSIMWDCVLSSEKRARISDQFVDLLRYAVEFGHIELAKRIWNEEQSQVRKFEILFQDEYAAFRSSCANGHLELVQSFWEWASTEQRCRMIGCKSGDALNTAARSGRLAIVRYLWENMDSRVAYEAIDSHGIDDVSLRQLIVTSLIFAVDISSPCEVAGFLSMLVSTPSDGRDPIYPPTVMKGILVAALTSGNGNALYFLVRQAKIGSDDDRTMLRSLIDLFNDDQRLRLRSKLTTEDDIKVCGLGSMQIAIQPVLDHGTGGGEDVGEDEEEDEDEESGEEEIDLTELDEYYDGF